MNNKGFTMVELLVAMAIMGLLMIMAFPTMRAVQLNNEKKKFESFGESVLSAAKLYADSYSEDLFDPSIKNQYKIIYLSEIQKKGLIKDINISESSCINGESNVTIVKYNNDYAYCLHLKCTNKNDSNNVIYETENTKGSCSSIVKVNVTYKYKNNSKTYEVIKGDDSYRLLSPTEVGFDEFLQNDKVKFEKWNKGNVGNIITISGNTIITPLIHKFNYKIKYEKSNNSITESTSDTNCTVDGNCILKENGFKYSGYTFSKWHRNSNNKEYGEKENVKDTIGKSITKDNEVVTLTTKFRINKVNVYLYANGGDFATTYNHDYTKDSNGKISYKNEPIIHKINYNDKIGSLGLTNWNNEDYLNLEKTGHKAKIDAEWNTKSDGTGTSFDQTKNYKADELCPNIDKEDCNLNLYVNWEKKTYTLKFDKNGGKGTCNDITRKYNEEWGKLCKPKKEGYVLEGWYTEDNGKGTRIISSSKATSNLTVHANWNINKPHKPTINNPYQVDASGNINAQDITTINENRIKWSNESYSLTLKSNKKDNKAIIGNWYYGYMRNGKIKWTEYTDAKNKTSYTTTEFTAERNENVYIRVCNKEASGPTDEKNCSDSSTTIIKIDKTKPKVEYNYGCTKDYTRYIPFTTMDEASKGRYYCSEIVAFIKITDKDATGVNNGSGVYSRIISVGRPNGDWLLDHQTNYISDNQKYSFIDLPGISGDRISVLISSVTDYAGNTATDKNKYYNSPVLKECPTLYTYGQYRNPNYNPEVCYRIYNS